MVVGKMSQLSRLVSKMLGRGIDYDLSQSTTPSSTTKRITPEEFTLRTIAGRQYLTVRQAKSMAQFIIFPGDSPDDKWKCAARAKLIEAVDAMYVQGYFDICPINSALSTFKLKRPPSVQNALDDLHHIHCVHFDKLSEEVFEAIPRYLTHIFTEGRVPLEPIEREGDLDPLNDAPEASSPRIKELNEILEDALNRLAESGAGAEIMDALKARQVQAMSDFGVA